jgi:hypothetical protein
MKTVTLTLPNALIQKVQNECYITINNKKLQIKPSKFMLNCKIDLQVK